MVCHTLFGNTNPKIIEVLSLTKNNSRSLLRLPLTSPSFPWPLHSPSFTEFVFHYYFRSTNFLHTGYVGNISLSSFIISFKFNAFFSGDQSCQCGVCIRRFEDSLSPSSGVVVMMKTEIVSETSGISSKLTRLFAREDFIVYRRHESSDCINLNC
jgi:hypothetical protein